MSDRKNYPMRSDRLEEMAEYSPHRAMQMAQHREAWKQQSDGALRGLQD